MLLLDEPTNHLDAESVAWLERYLAEFPGTVVAVTHDRYFLDNVAKWILELDRGFGIPWEGNYSSWLDQKKRRLAVEEKQEKVEFVETPKEEPPPPIELNIPAQQMAAAAQTVHQQSGGRSAGNGSLMRTGVVALTHLDDPAGLVEAAMAVSALTHYQDVAQQSCAVCSRTACCVRRRSSSLPTTRRFCSSLTSITEFSSWKW